MCCYNEFVQNKSQFQVLLEGKAAMYTCIRSIRAYATNVKKHWYWTKGTTRETCRYVICASRSSTYISTRVKVHQVIRSYIVVFTFLARLGFKMAAPYGASCVIFLEVAIDFGWVYVCFSVIWNILQSCV